MIGVAKNQSVSRFASRSRTSRKWTVSADTQQREPERQHELHEHDRPETTAGPSA